MTGVAPLDVVLSVHDDDAGGYRVGIIVADGGTATATATRDDLGAGDFEAGLEFGTDRETRERIGSALFGGLIRGDVAGLWAGVAAAADAGREIRVRLEIGPTDLRGLPWELMRGEDWLFLRPGVSMWRGLAPSAADPVIGPLRVLVVVCNPDDRTILIEDEVSQIAGAMADTLARTHLEILDGPKKPAELSGAIARLEPHVLHFIGHGMPRVAGRPGGLAFDWNLEHDEQDDAPRAAAPWELLGDEVRTLLPRAKPRLVVINACRTAGTPLDQIGGIASAFLDAGAGAVIAMQADVESPGAVEFASALYRGIGAEEDLDRVVGAARIALAHERDTGQWATPVLACRSDPGQLLRTQFGPSDDTIRQLCNRVEYRSLRDFLNHTDSRRSAWWAIDPPATAGQDSRPLLVIGGRSSRDDMPTGKTWFTRWCLLTYFLRGHRITYVDLARTLMKRRTPTSVLIRATTKDWLDVLRMIRDACLDAQQPEPLPPETFASFTAGVNRLAAGHDEPGDLGLAFDDDREQAEDYRAELLESFRRALLAAGTDRPHVIALDNVDRMLTEAFDDALYPGLIRPIAQQYRPTTHLMLVGPSSWFAGRFPAKDERLWRPEVQVGDFDPDQLWRLGRDFAGRSGYPYDKFRPLLEAFAGNSPSGIAVNWFQKAADLFELTVGR
jgi:hypothetical protein